MANLSKFPRFPILRLPILAVNEVLTTMNPFELINFSMCNPTTKCIAKSFCKIDRGFRLFVGIYSGVNISIYGKDNESCWEFQFKNKNAEKEMIESDNKERKTYRYSEDVIEDWKSLFEYIDDLMSFKTIDAFHFDLDEFPDLNQPMMEFLKTWNKPVNWLEVQSKNQADDVLKQLLSEFKVTGTLNIFAKFSENFQLTIPKLSNVFCFDDAKWISFNQLLELNARNIRLKESKFTEVELIAFFQSWMLSESHLNLCRFEIRIKERNIFEIIYQELPHEETSFCFYENYTSGLQLITVPFAIAITRNDGELGRMFLEQQWNGLFLKFMKQTVTSSSIRTKQTTCTPSIHSLSFATMANVSKMQRFPILRLPILAINEVLITMTPFELINFSMCNPTTKNIVKSFFKIERGFRLFLGNILGVNISIYGDDDEIRWKYQIRDKTANGIEPVDNDDPEHKYRITTRYSEDVIGDWKSLVEYIDNLMNFETIEELFIDLDVLPETIQPMIDCLKTWKKPVKWLEINSKKQADDILKQVLSEFTVTEVLNMYTPFSDNFQSMIPKSLDILCFNDAKWITFNQLLELDAEEIRLEETKFTHVELIAFFKSWMLSESHLNMDSFEIGIKESSVFEAVFQELPHEVVSFWFWRNYSQKGPTKIDVPFGIAITRNDGKVGRIFLETFGDQLFLVFMVL